MCDFIFIPIFCGTWDQVRSLGPELITCPRCHNNAIQTIKRRTWMTLYCIPVFPISRKRILYHCDICRWEGRPMGTVQVVPERGHRNHHRNRDMYSPQSTSRGLGAAGYQRSEQFQPEPYSRNDYAEAPPPPYSKIDGGGGGKNAKKGKPKTATGTETETAAGAAT